MFDNIMLIIAAILTWALGLAFITLNTAGNVGPYFIGGLCIAFACLSLRITFKYWNVRY